MNVCKLLKTDFLGNANILFGIYCLKHFARLSGYTTIGVKVKTLVI